jgi:hypothetical protein
MDSPPLALHDRETRDAAWALCGVIGTYAALVVVLHPAVATAVVGAILNVTGAGLLTVAVHKRRWAPSRASLFAFTGVALLTASLVATLVQDRPAPARFWDLACSLALAHLLVTTGRATRRAGR